MVRKPGGNHRMIIKSSDQVPRTTLLKRFPIPRNFGVTRNSRIGDRRFSVEIDSLNGPSSVPFFEMDLRCCMDAFDGDARFRQLKRESH